ncbi:hypothetical protein NESM_000549600 [Novymonas esmeraldas]|uniref:Uncharacterized protein n=1 Tax=Novymonas esmeraldas TaxID=1808958 RepID=A0AAW0ERK7_9TRYP
MGFASLHHTWRRLPPYAAAKESPARRRRCHAVLVQSELRHSHHAVDDAAVTTVDVPEAARNSASPVRSRVDVVDVDADDGDTAVAGLATYTPRSSQVCLRDAVVLSYSGPSDDYHATWCTAGSAAVGSSVSPPLLPPPVDELLSVAVDGSRVLLRRSGLTAPPHTSGTAALRLWREGRVGAPRDSDDDDDNDESGGRPRPQRQHTRQRAGHHGERFYRWCDSEAVTHDTVDALDTRVSGARWRQEASVLLHHARGTLHRVRVSGGSGHATVSSCPPPLQQQQQQHSSSSSAPASADAATAGGGSVSRRYPGSRCRADFIALSLNTVALVRARDCGADLCEVQHTRFACEMSASAVCMDDCGPHGTVVGFSDGTLRVVDWRVPPRHRATHATGGALDDGVDEDLEDGDRDVLRTHVPQPAWLARQDGRTAASVAGVLSCCAVAGGPRVLCGLGDASGAVVVADLRRPDSGARPRDGRRRTRAEQQQQQAARSLFTETGGQSPTGLAVADIQPDPACFGRIGLVDVGGTAVLTTVAALDGYDVSDAAPATAKRVRTGERGSRAASSAGAGVARPRLPSPPSPWAVVERLETMSQAASRWSVLASVLRTLRGGAFHLDSPSLTAAPGHPRPRCVFSSDGGRFIDTAVRGGGGVATLRCTATGAPSHSTVCIGTVTRIQLSPAPSPFMAVSCVDGLLCLDTCDGDTLAIPLDTV